MKKLLALVLALVMSMSLVTISNAAFKDADKIDYKEAVDVMNAVGVFIGDEKGNFNAKENLTREQAAKIIAYLELGSKAADAMVGGNTFTDVASSRWSAGFIAYCAQASIVSGVGDGKFAPDAKLTRGMLVTTLYRLADEPEVTEPATFQDVSEGRYFSDAIAWAEDVGIAKGITETHFAPDSAVTREQAVTFLYRYVTEYLKETPVTGGNLSSFTDAGSVSDYAKTAMSWATAQGLLEGYGDGTVGPKNPVTRAQMAKFLTILSTAF